MVLVLASAKIGISESPVRPAMAESGEWTEAVPPYWSFAIYTEVGAIVRMSPRPVARRETLP